MWKIVYVFPENLEKLRKKSTSIFPMKASSIGPPKIYLVAKVDKVQFPNDVKECVF